jgi:hypothetical protein
MACAVWPRKNGVRRADNPPRLPPELRRGAIELLRAGRMPHELSESLGVSEKTLRSWSRQIRLIAVSATTGSRPMSAPSLRGSAGRTRAYARSATCSSEPRPSSRRRAGPGELLVVERNTPPSLTVTANLCPPTKRRSTQPSSSRPGLATGPTHGMPPPATAPR